MIRLGFPAPSLRLPMSETVLRTKLTLTEDTFGAPQEDVLPLKWSIAVWLALSAISWAGVYLALSIIL